MNTRSTTSHEKSIRAPAIAGQKNMLRRAMVGICSASVIAVAVVSPAYAASDQYGRASAGCTPYTVRYGDYLSRIAAQFGTSVSAIMRSNYLNGTWIYPGQQLCVPQFSGVGYFRGNQDPGFAGNVGFNGSVGFNQDYRGRGRFRSNRFDHYRNFNYASGANQPVQNSSNGNWFAEYFNNTGLSGSPAYSANVQAVNFNWVTGSPNPAVQVDGFSARFTTRQYFNAATYTFTGGADDGIRVYVDGNLIIDQWHDESFTNYSANVTLAAGGHDVRVEYYENTNFAGVQLTWQQQ